LDLQDDVMRASLAIVYLPATTLPALSLHSAYLPVLAPLAPLDGEASPVMRHAAEDDWELLGVPANRTVFLGSDKTPVISADEVSRLEPWRAFEVIRNVLDSPYQQIKAVSENGHPVRTVTMYVYPYALFNILSNSRLQLRTCVHHDGCRI
jgi:hypothetical protein